MIVIALRFFADLKRPEAWKRKWAFAHRILENKWYVDEFYDAVFVRPLSGLSVALWKGFDIAVIDRIVVGTGRITAYAGQTVRVVQAGSVQLYALILVMGLVASVGYLIYGLV